MPESEDLEVQSGPRPSYGPKRKEERNNEGEHESSLFDAGRKFNPRPAYEFLVVTANATSCARN